MEDASVELVEKVLTMSDGEIRIAAAWCKGRVPKGIVNGVVTREARAMRSLEPRVLVRHAAAMAAIGCKLKRLAKNEEELEQFHFLDVALQGVLTAELLSGRRRRRRPLEHTLGSYASDALAIADFVGEDANLGEVVWGLAEGWGAEVEDLITAIKLGRLA
jgi:hypothetical protein